MLLPPFMYKILLNYHIYFFPILNFCVLKFIKFMLSTFGFADVEILSGLVNGAVPLFEAYNAPANFWGSIQVAAQNCFETMRTNEFFDSRYINLFYKLESFYNLFSI